MVVLWKWTLIFGVFVLSLNAGHAYAAKMATQASAMINHHQGPANESMVTH